MADSSKPRGPLRSGSSEKGHLAQPPSATQEEQGRTFKLILEIPQEKQDERSPWHHRMSLRKDETYDSLNQRLIEIAVMSGTMAPNTGWIFANVDQHKLSAPLVKRLDEQTYKEMVRELSMTFGDPLSATQIWQISPTRLPQMPKSVRHCPPDHNEAKGNTGALPTEKGFYDPVYDFVRPSRSSKSDSRGL